MLKRGGIAMDQHTRDITVFMLVVVFFTWFYTARVAEIASAIPQPVIEVVEAQLPICSYEPVEEKPTKEIITVEDSSLTVSEENINLIARLTYAESGSCSEMGQRMVIDTILNRVDHEHYPDTIHDVIYQRNAFTPMWTGWYECCEATDEIIALVKEELVCRTNSEVIFFTAGGYGRYGKPLFNIDNQYFSSYD